ncbi:E3 ubiquitin-protein ligase TRIM39-like [Poecilia formosa]|uniref:E3 ubiquitin-protein ligase TRIM39-like n=1 Tax=Poecilia formosa TaxID=48698 RepID=A0A087YQI7_POEFO|nr:PREDICTED: E3 ubiquitin-protein ligase TRIM39-like [Poecilia formosa]
MASACSILYEEQVLCSICLSEFKEPVSTPCGHNFCKGCITQYWNSQDSRPAQCPLCKKKLGNKPKLQVNSEFRDVVEHFNHTRLKTGPKIVAQPGEVPCDICTEPKLKAHKTCLVCLASYCKPHLESHQNLKKHKLIDPVSNLEDRVCKKHDKMLELFCRTDQKCVCIMCLNDDHTGHEAVPLECGFKDRRGMYENVTLDMKKTENSKSQSVKKLKDSVQKSRKISVNDIGQIAEVLAALVLSLQKKQDELVRAIKQKQIESEKQTEGRITLLEQHLSDLRKRRSEIEQLIKSEDYLYLLQNCPSNFTSANATLLDPLTEQHTYAGLVKQSVGQIKKSINREIDMLIQKISSSDCCGAENMRPSTPNVWRPPKDKLMMIQQCNAVDVTLNSYSAHPYVIVSADGKTLSYRPTEHFFTPLGWRFRHYYAVLGNEGFSSGRFYYEVEVNLNRSWTLGVVKESINRDELFPFTPEHGVWVFLGSLCPPNIRRIGVFVDYERGEVSFYNTETRDLLHSIAGCCFTETKTGLQAFLYSVVGLSTVHRPKLHPFFLLSGFLSDSLTITPVECTSQDA